VLRCAVDDPVVSSAFFAVTALLAAPTSLMRPAILSRVLGSALKRSLRSSSGTSSQLALSSEALAMLRARPAFGKEQLVGITD
ncbi:MAG TPA: hypothetical protein VH593_01265, partial [Ktedonobacteraceae bacterium]